MNKFLSQAAWCCLVLLALMHLTMVPAEAYLDPTMGSYTIQALAGSVLTAAFIIKKCWAWIRLKLTQSRDDHSPKGYR